MGYFANQLLANKTDKANKTDTSFQKDDAETNTMTHAELITESTNTRSLQPVAEVASDPLEEKASDDLLRRRIAATNNWLTNQAPSTVSIQLMGVPEGPELKNDLELLSQKIELDEIYVYRTQVSGQPYLSVLYGSFDNRADALAALKELPEEIRRNKPQLRTVSGVLQETKQLP